MRPLITKSLASSVGFILGDLLAAISSYPGPYNVLRSLQMGLFGAAIHAPLGQSFYRFLNKIIPENTKLAVVFKLLVDQIVWSPSFIALFLTFNGILRGLSPHLILLSMKKHMCTLLLVSWCVWPLAHLLNVLYVSRKMRLLYFNLFLCSKFQKSAIRMQIFFVLLPHYLNLFC